eukprot:536377-Pelagomonas_calceolata.AAC.7
MDFYWGSAADVASSAMLAIDHCKDLEKMGWRLVMQRWMTTVISSFVCVLRDVEAHCHFPRGLCFGVAQWSIDSEN